MKNRIADANLAEEGGKSYHWAYEHMPALTRTITKLADQKPLKGLTAAVCLHITKETSVLAMGLKTLGADVYLAAANPLSTQDDIAAYLASQGVHVFAWRGQNSQEYQECIRDILRSQPDIIMDDGADTHVTIHEEAEFKNLKAIGGTEETTTGIIRLKALEKSGKMRYPIIGVNNAYTKHLFDNRYGTGQSTIDGILRATSLLLAGKKIVVCGYGWVGKGIAMRARGMGGLVTVTEIDPFRAIEARMDGYEVIPIAEAAKIGDIFVTATGQYHIIRGEHLSVMNDGAILANAGHFNVEIDVDALEKLKKKKTTPRRNVDEYLLKNGKKIYLVGEGRIANLVAAEGHPPEVMSLSFSNQLLSAVYLSQHKGKLEKRVNNVPIEIDRQVAINALEAMGIQIDTPTEEQVKYGESWIV
ncbi:MAG: adenosylhomocysteinase [Thaumarchaeota archaeon]|nr:adenosylhomocysteinase [Nitrososphaerota archaeon]